MANKTLELIRRDLDGARECVKQAAQRANQVGDKSGAEQILKHDKDIKKTQEDFDKKGK